MKRAPIIVAAILCAVHSCAPPPDERDRWDGPVALCFPEAGPDDADAIAQVREAAQVWMSSSGATFYVQESCDSQPQAGAQPAVATVSVYFMTDLGSLAATDHLGRQLASGGEVRLKSDYPMNDPVCGDRGSVGRLRCIRGEAVHELGHVLGFSHDHVSVNAPRCAGMSVSQEDTDAHMTYYDPASVMNYCNPRRWLGELSEADICSVQVAYPKAGARERSAQECIQIAARSTPASGPARGR